MIFSMFPDKKYTCLSLLNNSQTLIVNNGITRGSSCAYVETESKKNAQIYWLRGLHKQHKDKETLK